jgi:hypothetical protein
MPQSNNPATDEADTLISTLWRHKKSGAVYVIGGECKIEATNETGILYSSVQNNGPLWCRPKSEFLDGRFLRLKVS